MARKIEMRRTGRLGHRSDLLDATIQFITSIVEVPGVQSVSLLGSIVTDRPDPKDIDLLLTIADDTDVSVVAAHARRLQGRAQQLNRGADVFLADERGTYLGRTCHWKESASRTGNWGPGTAMCPCPASRLA